MTPGGIRMGTPALTSRLVFVTMTPIYLFYRTHIIRLSMDLAFRGFTQEDFDKVAEFFDRAVTITQLVKEKTGSKIKDFKSALTGDDNKIAQDFPEIALLKKEVVDFARKFPTVGF